jgi:hypothetical protein
MNTTIIYSCTALRIQDVHWRPYDHGPLPLLAEIFRFSQENKPHHASLVSESGYITSLVHEE